MTPTTKLFIGRDISHGGEGYMSAIDQIFAVTQSGEDVTLAEIDERVRARFGHTSQKTLENVLNRACRRGEFIKIKFRGRANIYRRSSS